ncbi:glycosyltransferase [Jatrophihabitans sp. YIM 134969]
MVPTRNESGNVRALHARLDAAMAVDGWKLVFVDDSDDDTPEVLAGIAALDARVEVIHREGADRTGGLGGAVMRGVAHSGADVVVVMDGDLQHPPETVPRLVERFSDPAVDLVVASRHVEDGSSSGLSNTYRRVASWGCQKLAYLAVPRSRGTSDPLSGFFAFRRQVVAGVELKPDGFKILLEVLARGRWTRAADVPFEFAERGSGDSKSDIAEARRYLRQLRALWTGSAPHTRAHIASEALSGHAGGAPLRVLIFTSEAPPVVSGISTCVRNLERTLTGLGHEVDVVSRADFPAYIRGEIRLSAFIASWPKFRRTLGEYDVVNVHGPVPSMSEVFLLLVRTVRRAERPTVVYTHHSDVVVERVAPVTAVYNRLTPLFARVADVVLVSSQAYADKFRHLPAPVEVIPWGVDTAGKILPREEEREAALRVLFVGQLRPYKGVGVLLDAVRELPDVAVTIVGDGPERASLEAAAAGSAADVRFRGRVTDEQLWEAYSEHDVVILPSLTSAEAYGLVLAEGMAAGCVPVASDLPGVREVAGPTGILVPPGDAAAIRNALTSLADGSDLLAALATASIARAEALSVDANGARHEQVFRRALDDRHTPSVARVA